MEKPSVGTKIPVIDSHIIISKGKRGNLFVKLAIDDGAWRIVTAGERQMGVICFFDGTLKLGKILKINSVGNSYVKGYVID